MRKKRSKSIIALAVLAFTAAFVLPACSGSDTEGSSKSLNIGVLSDVEYMSKLSEATGKYYGLEIDIAEEMSERMGYGAPNFISVTKDNREDLLSDGTIDCLVATYTISDFRKESFDFSDSYYTDTISVLVEDSTLFTEMKDLLGGKIGVIHGANAGFEFAACMADMGIIPDFDRTEDFDSEDYEEYFTIVKYEDIATLTAALEDGSIDAVCADKCILKGFMTDERTEIDGDFAEQSYGVATLKGSALTAQVGEAVNSMLKDGTVGQLIEKWDLNDEE